MRLLAERAKANQESEERQERGGGEFTELKNWRFVQRRHASGRGQRYGGRFRGRLIAPEGWSEDAIAPNVVAGRERRRKL